MLLRDRLPAALLAWVLVVAGASTAIWFVIGRAGAAVSQSVATPAQVVTATRQPTNAPSTAHASPGPMATLAAPTPRPGQPTTGSPKPDLGPSSPRPPALTDSWVGAAGRVTATCRGNTISLDSASPADGYRLDKREGSGTTTLTVEFEGPSETKIRASCGSSGPVFRVSTGD